MTFGNTTDFELRRHLLDPNPHPGKFASDGTQGISESTANNLITSALATHVAESDPHPQYATDSLLSATLAAHLAASGDHVASLITNDSTVSGAFVDDALNTLRSADATLSTNLAAHIASSAAHIATNIYYEPTTSGLSATNAQAAIDEVEGRVDLLELIHTDTKEPTGFLDKTDVDLAYTDGTRLFEVSPVATSFEYYVLGTKQTVTTTKSVTWTDVEGNHYFYFDSDGVLHVSHESDFATEQDKVDTIIRNNAYVSLIYWDATNKVSLPFCERHGCVMDHETHAYLHLTRGAQLIPDSGATPGDFTADDTGNLDAHAQFSITSARLADEDNISTLAAKLLAGDIPLLYQEGATGTWRWVEDSAGVVNTGTGRAAWNENSGGTWGLTEVSNQQFVLAHIYGAPIVDGGYVAIIGQNDYNTIIAARQGAEVELVNIVDEGLPSPEFVPIATVIYQTSDVYSNTWKSRVRTNDLGTAFIDWRGISNQNLIGGANDHGALSGLTDADHPATAVTYDNSTSGLAATLVQDAIDEIDADLDTHIAATGAAVHGLGTISTQNANNVSISGGSVTGITDLAVADGGTGASTAADARTNLGLVIGTDVQAWSTFLDDLSDGSASGLTLTTTSVNGVSLDATGGGTLFLADDGTYSSPTAGAGGSSGQVQYNSGGALAGIAGSVWDGTRLTLPSIDETLTIAGASNNYLNVPSNSGPTTRFGSSATLSYGYAGTTSAWDFVIQTNSTVRTRWDDTTGDMTHSADLIIGTDPDSGSSAVLRVDGAALFSGGSTPPTPTSTQVLIGGGDVAISGRVLSTANKTTDSHARFGSFEIQGFALNNAWLGENIYYNSGFKLRQAGTGVLLYTNNSGGAGRLQINVADSGSAGAAATLTTVAEFTKGTPGTPTASQVLVGGGDIKMGGTVFNAANLPTSAAGLATGDFWVDTGAGNVVKRV